MIEMTNPHCCLHPHIVMTDQYYTCTSCGTVISKRYTVLQKATWLGAYRNVQHEVRNTVTVAVPHTDLGNNVERKIMEKNGALFRRLNKINRSCHSGTERHYFYAYKKVRLFARELELPVFITSTAWKIYRKCHDKDMMRGRCMEGFAAASVLLACRIMNFPLFLHEIDEQTDYNTHTFIRLILKAHVLKQLGYDYKPLSPSDAIKRACSILNVSMETLKASVCLMNRIETEGFLTGVTPIGVATAIIYTVSRFLEPSITQQYIADSLRITDATIRNNRKLIKPIISPILHEVVMHYGGGKKA